MHLNCRDKSGNYRPEHDSIITSLAEMQRLEFSDSEKKTPNSEKTFPKWVSLTRHLQMWSMKVNCPTRLP